MSYLPLCTRPPVLSSRMFFYPFGNTPPVLLSAHLPDDGDRRLLLLGCGDLRSVLYSIYRHPPRNHLDITVCDYEAGVIARNILLIHVLLGDDIDLAWDLFYQQRVSRPILERMRAALIRLLADNTIVQIAQFNDLTTTHLVHNLWRSYVDDIDAQISMTRSELVARAVQFTRARSTNSHISWRARAKVSAEELVAPTFSDKVINTLPAVIERYVDTGFLSADESSRPPAHINPTMSITGLSGHKGAVHYGAFPLEAFSLVHVAANDGDAAAMIADARDQLGAWARSLREACPHVTLRFAVSDALDFAHVAKSGGPLTSSSGVCCRQRRTRGEVQVATAPFDVIDTSNLSDHVGLVNLLTAVVPLLAAGSGTILTESLVARVVDGSARRTLDSILCSDAETIALLLGIAPTILTDSYDIRSISARSIMFAAAQTDDATMSFRLTWRSPSPSPGAGSGIVAAPPMQIDDKDVGPLFSHIFSALLDRFDVARKMRDMINMKSISRILGGVPVYTPLSFVALCHVALDRLTTTARTAGNLFGYVEQAMPKMTHGVMNQEMCLYAHALGLYRADMFVDPVGMARQIAPNRIAPPPASLANVDSSIAISLISVKVPCTRLPVLCEQACTLVPYLSLASQLISCANTFQSASCTWVVDGDGNDADGAWLPAVGDRGHIVISAIVPTALLLADPGDLAVSVVLDPSINANLVRELGIGLDLVSAPITDSTRVTIRQLRDAPFPGMATPVVTRSHQDDAVAITLHAQLSSDKGRVDALVCHVRINGDELEGGAPVTIEAVAGSLIDVRLLIAGVTYVVVRFPFAVDALAARGRVARRSRFVDMIVPIMRLRPGDASIAPQFRFRSPIDRAILPDLADVITIDRLPSLHRNTVARQTLIHVQTGMMFSKAVRSSKVSTSNFDRFDDPLNQCRDSLLTIFKTVSELPEVPQPLRGCRWFLLHVENGGGGVFAAIYVDAIRFDAAANAALADAAVCCLTMERLDQIAPFLQSRKSTTIRVTASEELVWKRLLPACVARVASEDAHDRRSCEYVSVGCAPLPPKFGARCYCSCTDGRWQGSTLSRFRAALGPVASDFSRAAIPFLFFSLFTNV